jgi:hypothetical protein
VPVTIVEMMVVAAWSGEAPRSGMNKDCLVESAETK